MHYVPGTPWFDPAAAELELEMAAGHFTPATTIAPSRQFRPVLALAGYLGIEFALISFVLWLN